MLKLIRKRIRQYFSFQVVIYWDGLKAVHYARNKGEAQEWINCYPANALAYVFDPGNWS